MKQNNFFIFTGGPGAGKTTVLNALKDHGFHCVDEVARAIIREQHRLGGTATHTQDQLAFCQRMLAASISEYQQRQNLKEPVFFDRGLPGLSGYVNMVSDLQPPDFSSSDRFKQTRADVTAAIKHHLYNPYVFCFPPWKAIYQNDTERQQPFNEAIITYHHLKAAHRQAGYIPIDVPLGTVQERVQFIISIMTSALRINDIQPVSTGLQFDPSVKQFTSCLILTHNNRLLLQQRNHQFQDHPNTLSAFGGKIERGESPIEAILRELQEELGATPRPKELTPLGTITEALSAHTEPVHTYFWHDQHNLINGCYEGQPCYFHSPVEILVQQKWVDDVIWLLSEAQKKQLIGFTAD